MSFFDGKVDLSHGLAHSEAFVDHDRQALKEFPIDPVREKFFYFWQLFCIMIENISLNQRT
jgi:hypothetical protein